MKRTLTLFACVAVCCAMMASCKNAKTTEPTPEEIQAQKVALADTVLTKIDALAEQYWTAQDGSSIFDQLKLTDEEKMVKPNYLLDPSVANTLVTKSQKVNALAMYVMDIAVYKAYDMPYDNIRAVAVKLAADLNMSFDTDFSTGDELPSEKIKATYKISKERGDLSFFWQFQHALIDEGIYILSQNPELFLSKITDEQWQEWAVVKRTRLVAFKELAKYDEEMAQLWEVIFASKPMSVEDGRRIDQSLEVAKQFYTANKSNYAAMRNALLQ